MSHDSELFETLDALQNQLQEIRSRIESLPSSSEHRTTRPLPLLRRYRTPLLIAAAVLVAGVAIFLASVFARRND